MGFYTRMGLNAFENKQIEKAKSSCNRIMNSSLSELYSKHVSSITIHNAWACTWVGLIPGGQKSGISFC